MAISGGDIYRVALNLFVFALAPFTQALVLYLARSEVISFDMHTGDCLYCVLDGNPDCRDPGLALRLP